MSDVRPSESKHASSLTNDPTLWPFVGLEAGQMLSLNNIPEDTALDEPSTGQSFTPQGVINNLARFRMDFPFVPIIPFPNTVRTVALIQNAAKDVRIPDGVVAVMFKGSGNYYVSNNGNAEVPVAAQDNDSGSNFGCSLFKPENFMFYTGGIRTLSVITPDAGGCVVTIMGYAPSEMPRYGPNTRD